MNRLRFITCSAIHSFRNVDQMYLHVFTTSGIRNAGSSDGSEISELMENNASWVDNRSKVIHSSTANPTFKSELAESRVLVMVLYTNKRLISCRVFIFSLSLQFIHGFEISTGVPVATQQKLVNK